MNELHILNAGRADCIVMLLDTPQERKCVVPDAGGCTYQGKMPLLTFLRNTDIRELVSLKMETPGPYMGTREDLDAYMKAFY